ncbi:DUF1203 domain-containing protein [Epibacterium sp. SM1979]|uniref:DUF1203 domain-containing protein n=1 Tax=Tritonibacter litoralis TaxID=2662264 RepID=A0A843YJV4_9RHOB|nr:DUF1203 domain-containing protein [Tritonibacter litoralis]MQQ08977.1 DUF1203 domain-containing protein [Tritonibacter litoralis]
MTYHITGLDPAQFAPLFGLSDAELAERHIQRHHVSAPNACPDRITMVDLEPGETALLLNYEHLPVDSPYRSRHAIYVKEGATTPYSQTDEVPAVMKRRTLALRGINDAGNIVDADLATGDAIEPLILRLFENPDIAYIHAHFAQRGCFAARIDRV